eukprot:m.122872 g.122872  ORF g.122872 m.122872 type:complete len:56 (-) comp9397_c1_seq10:2517-2684(-)
MRGGESIIKGNPCNRGLQIGGMCGLEEYSINTQKHKSAQGSLDKLMSHLAFCMEE